MSLQTLENLMNRIVWFSRPEKFNDPYDPAPPYPAELNDDELQIVYDCFSKRIPGKEEGDARFLRDGKVNNEFKLLTVKVLKEIVTEELNVKDIGIACFSSLHDELLMWSHYADGHGGFCLEFDTNYPPFNLAHEVGYSKAYPLMNLADMITNQSSKSDPYGLRKLFLTKSNQWTYEAEWRVFNNRDTGITYDKSALTAIYFGSEMSTEHRRLVAQLIDSNRVRKYEMRKSKNFYKLETHFLGDKHFIGL